MSTRTDSSVNFETFDFDREATSSNFIDKGAYGEVYGPFKWNKKTCAFKRNMISSDRKGDEFKLKVEKNKSVWTSVKHKNLIEIHQVILRPNALYIVMEYAGGRSLRHLLDNYSAAHRRIDVSNWATQIAEGMLYLHGRDIVHRDLKSINIMLMDPFDSDHPHKEMTLKITDFDDTREHKQTATMSLRGTFAYMAPEVLMSEQFSKASDVWSYGVVVWEMLTGELPHKGVEDATVIQRAISGQLTLSIPDSIHEEYKKLLRDCLHQDKSRRPSFEDITDQLTSFNKKNDKLPIDYTPKPVLVGLIRTKASREHNKRIIGFTFLGKQLYVLSGESSEVEVYNDFVKLSLSRQWTFKELVSPQDIGSCSRNNCLYILNYNGQSMEVLRVDSYGSLIMKWSTGDDYGKCLSVARESNVIVTIFNKNKLNEYSPDGQLIREIGLLSDICYPNYAIKLTTGHFMVSHGDVNELHRVCIMGADGKLGKSFGGSLGTNVGQIKHPFCLSVDGNIFLIVADQDSNRVLLLTSDLEIKREILSNELTNGLRYPVAILLIESRGRLLVADNESHNQRIVIFDYV